MIYGAFTKDELAFALDHLAEVRRRTLALLTERVLSQVETVGELAES